MLQRDLPSDGVSLDRTEPPVVVGSGCSLEPLDDKLAGLGGHGTWPFGRAGRCATGRSCGSQGVSGLHEFGRIEAGWIVEDGLLTGVEVAQLMVIEVAEAASEVAVGLELGVGPRGAGVGP
jgi:hypothetical protein